MGTFRVKLDALSSSTVGLSSDGLPPEPIFSIFNFNIPPFYTTDNATAAEYLSVLDNSDFNIGGAFQPTLGSTPLTATFQTGNEIILDGDEGNPLTFNGLPAGFKILNAKVVMNLAAQPYSVGVSMDLFLKQGNVVESAAFPVPIDTTLHIYEFPYVDVTSALDVLTGGCGFRIVPVDSIASFTYLYITGTYETQQFKFNIDTEAPVSVGQDIVISTDDKTKDLRKVTNIIVDYTTLDNVDHEVTITDFDATQFVLTFTMIDFGDAPKVTLKLTGTQFGGTVPLGDLLTIRFLDGTGIYRLDTTATHDTLYIQDYDPVQTIDVKIPNPFAKTAFVP